MYKFLDDRIDVFGTGFLSGPPAGVPHLKMELTPDARQILFRVRNYTQGRCEFLQKCFEDLARQGMTYWTGSSVWTSAPLLAPKDGPLHFRFSVDLRLGEQEHYKAPADRSKFGRGAEEFIWL